MYKKVFFLLIIFRYTRIRAICTFLATLPPWQEDKDLKTKTVTVKTITIGLKGKKALATRGIKSSLIKVDFTKTAEGCQYGLSFDERYYYNAISILKENGIEFGAYKGR